jgi:hypothetical protein
MESVAHTLAYDGVVMGDTNRGDRSAIERWASVPTPTIVIDGGASRLWARNAVQALVDVLPDARRRTLDGQTHEADPTVLAPLLTEFFAS